MQRRGDQVKHVTGCRAAASSRATGKSFSPRAAASNSARLSAPRMTNSSSSESSNAGIVSVIRSNGASGGSGSGVSVRIASGSSARGSVLGNSEATCPSRAHAEPGEREMRHLLHLAERDDLGAGGLEQRADLAGVARRMILGHAPVVARPHGHPPPVERHRREALGGSETGSSRRGR